MQEASKVNKKLAIENAELKKKLDDFKVPSSMSMVSIPSTESVRRSLFICYCRSLEILRRRSKP